MMNLNPPKFLLDIYFQLKPHSTKAWERYWSQRGMWNSGKSDKRNDWVGNYYRSVEHPHRKMLAEKIVAHNPKSILEIGCNCAPNLFLLKRYMDVPMTGVDISVNSVRIGEAHRAENNIKDLDLWGCRAEQIKDMGRKWDLVFTDAMMIYIDPKSIDMVMRAIRQVTNKTVVFLERHIDGIGWQGFYKDGVWNRDYVKLAHEYWVNPKIGVTKITSDIWPEWSENGYIIEVNI
jgi:ubiquinone/menaquinone biosynthesis C-methylase UbiE